jgi:hypothetical protein
MVNDMKEIGVVVGILVVWLVLNRWVLPWLGIATCMSGRCAVDPRPTVSQEIPEYLDQEGERKGP